MLLTVDIGNTNITLGVFEGKKLRTTFRMTTIQTRTSDEYGMVMCELLEHNQVKVGEITDVIVASVVPNVMHSLTSAIIKYYYRGWRKDRNPCDFQKPTSGRCRPYRGCGSSL